MRLAPTLAALGLGAALLFGCGGSGDSTTDNSPGGNKTPGMVKPGSTAQLRAAWERNPDCKHPPGASRWGCSVAPYRCQAVVTGRGWAVDCAKPGRSVGFTVPPRK
jgi:hypothetical protein